VSQVEKAARRAVGLAREPFELDVEDVGALRVLSFSGHEAMNAIGVFDVLIAAPDLDDRAVREMMGRPATLLVEGVDTLAQRFHGVVAAVAGQGRRERGIPLFRMRLVPAVALLAHRVTCRIFQELTTREIVDSVLAPHGIERRWDLSRSLPKRPYCVQYHESDLAFVMRMLAEDGIFFRFDHPTVDGARATSRDVLVLSDAAEKVLAIEGGERLPLRESIDGSALRADDAHISSFHACSEVAPDQALLRDFDFIHPRFEQRSLSVPLARSAPADLGGRLPGRLGVYEHKMEYEEPDLQPADAGRYLEQLRASSATFEGESRTARLRPGRSFILTEAAPAGGDARCTVTRV